MQWLKKEKSFTYEQSCIGSQLRIRDHRAKPIDRFIYLNEDCSVLPAEVEEPSISQVEQYDPETIGSVEFRWRNLQPGYFIE